MANGKGTTQPARQIGKAKLQQLVKAAQSCSSRCAEERQALGAKFEAAATSDNFNSKALRALMPLIKMEPGPQAHLWRTICLYAEHLGIGTQGDLEDEIARQEASEDDGEGSETADEGAAGEGDVADARALAEEAGEAGDPVDDVLAGLGNMDTPALGRFRKSLADALTAEAVNKGLERFTADHPESADQALEIAQARLEALDAEAGGGEDLRPDNLRQASADEAAATVASTTGRKPRKPRASKPKAGKADDGPAFGAAVH